MEEKKRKSILSCKDKKNPMKNKFLTCYLLKIKTKFLTMTQEQSVSK